jgi:hypothetical protein
LDFLEKDSPKIILITYQSFESLVNIIKEHEFMVDLLCFDEAHHILGNNMKKLLFGVNNDENYDSDDDDIDNEDDTFIDTFCKKTLFFTLLYFFKLIAPPTAPASSNRLNKQMKWVSQVKSSV